MDIEDIRRFKLVAEVQNITKASEMLSITQPGLSRTIKSIEKELGYDVFHRNPQKLSLNKEGTVFYEYACKILELYDEAISIGQVNFNAPRSIKIASQISSFKYFLLPKIMFDLDGVFSVDCEVMSKADALGELYGKKCDIAIVDYNPHQDGLGSLLLWKERIFLAVPYNHSLSKKKLLSRSDIHKLDILNNTDSTGFNEWIQSLFNNQTEKFSLINVNMTSMFAMIRKNKYPFFINSLSRNFLRDQTGYVYIPFDDPEFSRDIFLVYLRSNKNKSQDFIRYIVNNYGSIMNNSMSYIDINTPKDKLY